MRRKRVMKTGAQFVAAFAVALFAGGAHAAQHQSYSDEQIGSIVEHDLAKDGIGGVSVSVQSGVVTLSGTVKSAWEKTKAGDSAVEVHDVKSVVNQLTVRGGESDQILATEIGKAIERYVFYDVFDAVTASVLDSKVVLHGWVTWPFKATEIANHVSRLTGVKEVLNELEVLPVSRYDDEIRARLAVAIYRDLPEFANRPHPPIHIVVENGRVILAGAVRSNVEKARVEHIARSAFGVFSVDNQLRVDRASS